MTAHELRPGRIPTLVVAGTHSGVGKTTVTVGLCRAWRTLGYQVAVFKCGPDYLDPTYHARAADRPCHNLDGWMMGREGVLRTFDQGCRGADVALVEGVMGLYDGADATSDSGSTAEIARWLAAPVLLVCDASGMARSIAALARGFAAFDPALHLWGLWCNRVGSASHLELLRTATAGTPPVLGGLEKRTELAFPGRHLGLHRADASITEAHLDQVGEYVAAGWGHALRSFPTPPAAICAPRAAPLDAAPEPIRITVEPRHTFAARSVGTACRIAIAHDAAFHFYYEDNLLRLRQLGAELVAFSPITDTALPDADGVYLGGGYPELHAAALSRNGSMRHALAGFHGPIYAECGGLMYLTEALQTQDGARHPMVGRLPATAIMHDRLQALGYVEVETRSQCLLGRAGLRFRGHQFRYSELHWHGTCDEVYAVRRRRGGTKTTEGYADGTRLLASYVHAHWASNPLVAAALVQRCAAASNPSAALGGSSGSGVAADLAP